MKVRWKEFEFLIESEKDVELFKKIIETREAKEEMKKPQRTYNKQKIIKTSIEWAYNALKRALSKLDENKWYSGVEIIRLAGYDRNVGYFYYALTKLVEDGFLEEKREGRKRLFKLKSNEREEFDFKKYWQEERKVMEGVLK